MPLPLALCTHLVNFNYVDTACDVSCHSCLSSRWNYHCHPRCHRRYSCCYWYYCYRRRYFVVIIIIVLFSLERRSFVAFVLLWGKLSKRISRVFSVHVWYAKVEIFSQVLGAVSKTVDRDFRGATHISLSLSLYICMRTCACIMSSVVHDAATV